MRHAHKTHQKTSDVKLSKDTLHSSPRTHGFKFSHLLSFFRNARITRAVVSPPGRFSLEFVQRYEEIQHNCFKSETGSIASEWSKGRKCFLFVFLSCTWPFMGWRVVAGAMFVVCPGCSIWIFSRMAFMSRSRLESM